MPARVIAFLFTLLLLWSSAGAAEAPCVFAQTAGPAQALVDAVDRAAEHERRTAPGAVAGDLPSPAQSDPPAETPELMPAPISVDATTATLCRPRSRLSEGAGAPFLAGPLRPPCPTARAG